MPIQTAGHSITVCARERFPFTIPGIAARHHPDVHKPRESQSALQYALAAVPFEVFVSIIPDNLCGRLAAGLS